MATVPRAPPSIHQRLVDFVSKNDTAGYQGELLQYYSALKDTTYIHEWGHVLQNVVYPYLYLRSVRDLGLFDTILQEFQDDDTPRIGTRWSLDGDARESLAMPATPIRFTLKTDGSVELGAATPPRNARVDICEVDLLEEANSIFEFRVLIGGYGSGRQYNEWLRSGASYTRVFRLLSKTFDVELAYHMLPPLVLAAYHSTYPVTAFASLLQFVRQNRHKVEGEDPDALETILLDELSLRLAMNDEASLGHLATDDSFAYIGRRSMQSYLEQTPHHPLYPLARRAWSGKHGGRSHPWIYRPYDYVHDGGTTVRNDFKDFEPPFLFLVYDSVDVPLNRALVLSSQLYRNQFVDRSVDPDQRESLAAWVDALMKRRVLVYSLFKEFEGLLTSYCHHSNCDYFDSGLCTGHLRIPDVSDDCDFPDFVLHTIKRKYLKVECLLERK